jgi:GTP pyrophosphokinase
MDIQDLLKKNGIKDLEKLHKAYVYAAGKHRGQLRKSGEPYLSHPLSVAYILAEMNMDIDTVIGGILHDTLEDTDATYEEVAKMFGENVAFLVDGVSKIGKIKFKSTEEKQAENFRKMLISMSKDVRVIVIKLADRLHNMRTIDHLHEEKRRRVAKETLEIYAPLAHRLGIAWIKWEMEDMAFRVLKPETYYDIYNKVKLKRSERENYLNEIITILHKHLKEDNIDAEIFGRPKHFYSIYNKMVRKKTSFDEIYDLLALRILVHSVPECYAVLGLIHTLWKPIQGRFKDYIAMPKSNMYQSLHTTVIGPKGMSVEFQIRTHKMNRIAEEGIAAHWKYKEGKPFDPKEDRSFIWLRQLLDQKELKRPQDLVDALKEDVLPAQIYLFTPAGEVVELPRGSTPIDFAYNIHSEVGNTTVGAKVNGRMVPLRYKLKSGEKVEIMTSSTQEPRRDWLNFVKTNRAKTRIRSFLRKKEQDKAIQIGWELLDKEFKEHNLKLKEIINENKSLEKILNKFNLTDSEDLYKNVGFGRLSSKQVLHLFYKPEEKDDETTTKTSTTGKTEPFKIEGIDNVMVKVAGCCNPLPGDDVKGYVSRGRGVIVHKADCKNLRNMTLDEDRIMDVVWDNKQQYKMVVKLYTVTEDRPGMINDLTSIMNDLGVNIVEMSAKSSGDTKARQSYHIEVSSKDQLQKVINKIKSIKGVYSVVTR